MANEGDPQPPDRAAPDGLCAETCLGLLADPSRRAIVSRLAQAPASVGALAETLPISRPAVSQHLKALAEAGLVLSQAQGTRRVYRLNPEALAETRHWLEGLWGDVLARFAQFAHQEKEPSMIPPIEKRVFVPLEPSEAFTLFTARLAEWWPLDSHSLSAAEAKLPRDVTVEPREGGQIVETCADGKKRPWGRVTAWQPGERFAVRWHVGRPEEEATDLVIAFARVDGGTEVRLTHDGWAGLGPAAAQVHASYLTGWDHVLVACFGAYCLARAAA